MKKFFIALGMAVMLLFGLTLFNLQNEEIGNVNALSENKVYKEAVQSGLINSDVDYRIYATKSDKDGRNTEYTIFVDNGYGEEGHVYKVK